MQISVTLQFESADEAASALLKLEPKLVVEQKPVISSEIKIPDARLARVCQPWQFSEDEFLIANYGKATNRQLSKALRRTLSGVSGRLSKLHHMGKIKMSPDVAIKVNRMLEVRKARQFNSNPDNSLYDTFTPSQD